MTCFDPHLGLEPKCRDCVVLDQAAAVVHGMAQPSFEEAQGCSSFWYVIVGRSCFTAVRIEVHLSVKADAAPERVPKIYIAGTLGFKLSGMLA